MPLVDNRMAINKQANAVIRFGIKAIEARVKVDLPAPAHRKIIGRYTGRRRLTVPEKVNDRIISHQNWAALEISIGPIFPFPIRIRRSRNVLPPQVNGSVAAAFIIFQA
jgi:hypothetical protein